VTPSDGVFSFIAKDSGKWQLYRVRNWLDDKPLEDKLVLPGFFSKKDKPEMDHLYAQVFVSANGAYAVCVGGARWMKRVGGRGLGNVRSDIVISVVDLADFKVVVTTRTKTLDLFEFQEVSLDREGHVLVNSFSSDKPRRGAFIQLSLPSLTAGPKCSYDWIADSPNAEHPEPTSINECRKLLNSTTLKKYLGQEPNSITSMSDVCKNNDADFCHLRGEFTADGRFGVADHVEGHDNFLGNWVATKYSLVIFSTAKRMDIDEIKEPTNDSVEKALTSIGGHDYLLVMRGGRHLDVYELRE
jgi:hypothetical protein